VTDARYLTLFFAEKDLGDLEDHFEVTTTAGTWNLIPYGCVVEAIMATTGDERAAIVATLRRIDFVNGDVRHYLRHLGQGLARDLFEEDAA
jgi:hypothetical protein